MPTKNPATFDTTPTQGDSNHILPTLTDLANNPRGITSRHTVAKLLEVHVLTLARWVKAGKFPKPITIGNAHYFRNAELVDFIDQQATA